MAMLQQSKPEGRYHELAIGVNQKHRAVEAIHLVFWKSVTVGSSLQNFTHGGYLYIYDYDNDDGYYYYYIIVAVNIIVYTYVWVNHAISLT